MKLRLGVYFTVPSALVLTVPFVPCVTLATLSVSPSRSVSLASTSMSTAVSSVVLAMSFEATGASLTPPMVTVTEAVSQSPPLSQIS